MQHQDLQAARQRLIERLIEYKKMKGHDLTVVFDGWKSGGSMQVQSVNGGVRVIYSRLGETADRVIKALLEQERKDWIVITSDREIMRHAWGHNAVPVDSARFMQRLEPHDSGLPGAFELLEEDDGRQPRKGSPRRLSKKEKALMRVLGRL